MSYLNLKKTLLLLLASTLFACSSGTESAPTNGDSPATSNGMTSDDSAPESPVDDVTEDLDGMSIVGKGFLQGVNGYASAGQAELVFNSPSDEYSLILSNFSSSNGPSLRVYLSQGPSAANFTDLGALKSTNGNLRYDFPASQYNASFSHVLIWCDRFDVGFGEAALQ